MKKGFTLIEIVLAVSFLLIITIMVVPNMYTMVEKNNQKQLDKIENIILDGAVKYVNGDDITAERIKACGLDSLGASDCAVDTTSEFKTEVRPVRDTYSKFYISINDLSRMGFVPSNLKDPTQGSQRYDYSRVIEIYYSEVDAEYKFDIINIDEVPNNGITNRTLAAKAQTTLYIYVWYSGLLWEVYGIYNSPDGSVSSGSEDYVHIKLATGTLPAVDGLEPRSNDLERSLNCNILEDNLSNKSVMLVKRSTGKYCELSNGIPSVVLKNNQLFISGTGEITSVAPAANLPFVLLGDYVGYPGEFLRNRYIGEYVWYTTGVVTSKTRIVSINPGGILLEGGTIISPATVINRPTSPLILGDGSINRPYYLAY